MVEDINNSSGSFAIWIEVNATKNDKLFRIAIKRGASNWSRPKVVTTLQIVTEVIKLLSALATNSL